MYDICIIGHVTRDRIQLDGSPERLQPGGTVYYSGLAAARLGLRTLAITKLCAVDRAILLNGMETAGVAVRALDSCRTTEFVNAVSSGDSDERRQHVLAVADPFEPCDIDANAAVYLFGPLTRNDIAPSCVERAVSGRGLVAMDVQGLLRNVRGSRVELAGSAEALHLLRHVDILKAGRQEALLLTGERTIAGAARALAAAGPREVLITSGGDGSHVYVRGTLIPIPAFAPQVVLDTTGCGDTYLAAYVSHRLRGGTPEEAGLFASRVAGAKTAYYGAFRGPVSTLRGSAEARPFGGAAPRRVANPARPASPRH